MVSNECCILRQTHVELALYRRRHNVTYRFDIDTRYRRHEQANDPKKRRLNVKARS